jgi:hypothetical protein
LAVRRWCWGGAALGLLLAAVAPSAGSEAPDPLVLSLTGSSRDLLRGAHAYHLSEIDLEAQGAVRRGDRRRRLGVDISPAIQSVFGFFHRHGVPLREQRDERGGGLVGVQASFSVGKNLPAVSFNLGDRPVEPLGAFYSAERGFRCAVVWPVERFTLRLEGGEDSEFGYYGIAGLQWIHPTLPIAIGAGIPMNLRDAEGDVGAIIQFRMRLD